MFLLGAQTQELHQTRFIFPDRPNIRVVRIVGDFNEWEAPGKKLDQSLNGEGWNLSLNLTPGVYRYVYLTNGNTVPTGDSFARQVQILVLPPADFKFHAGVKGDGSITPSGVLHLDDAKWVRRLNLRTYALRLRTRRDDVANEDVAVRSDGGEEKIYPLKPIGSDPLFDYYEVKVVVNPAVPFTYRFLLDDGAGIQAYDKAGLQPGVLAAHPFRISPTQFKFSPASPSVGTQTPPDSESGAVAARP